MGYCQTRLGHGRLRQGVAKWGQLSLTDELSQRKTVPIPLVLWTGDAGRFTCHDNGGADISHRITEWIDEVRFRCDAQIDGLWLGHSS